MHKWIFNLARITNSHSTYLMYVRNTVNLSSFMWNCSWKRVWIFQTLVNPLLSPRPLPPFRVQSNVPCDIERGSLIRFSVARWQRTRGRPSIIRLKFQTLFASEYFFSAHPPTAFQGVAPLTTAANIRRLTRKSLVPVHRLSFIFGETKIRSCRARSTSTIDECANKCNFSEGYFNDKIKELFKKKSHCPTLLIWRSKLCTDRTLPSI